MSTAGDLITRSLRKLGVIASGEDPSSAESADGLESLNQLIENLSNERLLIPYFTKDSLTLTPSTGEYTIGSGGDFNTVRPLKIIKAVLKVTSQTPNFELPVDILNLEQWGNIVVKSTESDYPTEIYYDNNFASGLGKIFMYPVPDYANTLILYSQKILTSFAATTDTVTLPPGYKRMLEFNLAIDLAPEYGMEPSGAIQKVAMESKANLKRTNSKEWILGSEAADLTNQPVWDYYTGD